MWRAVTWTLLALALAIAACVVGLRYAFHSGPSRQQTCEAGKPVRLASFLGQMEPFLRRFHDPIYTFDPRDLRGHFASRPGGVTDLYGSADMVFVLWILDELETRTTEAGRREWSHGLQSFQDPASGRFLTGGGGMEGSTHATAFATAALKLLGAQPRYPHRFTEPLFADPAAIDRWLDGFNWQVIWKGSHELGAAAAVIDAPQGVNLPDEWTTWLWTAFEKRRVSTTGFWKNGLLDVLWRQPHTVDLGGAAHFWWLYDRIGKPLPYPKTVITQIIDLQRASGLWGARALNGAFPQGIDFDAINGMRLAYGSLPESDRAELKPRMVAALDLYGCAVNAHLVTHGSVERLFLTSHKIVGTLNALAELDLLYQTLTGKPKLDSPRRLRSALTVVSWQ